MKTTEQTVKPLAETYQVIQVKDGKFHRPEQTTHERGQWFRPMSTRCGCIVTPYNVFPHKDDALSYTGGRDRFLCRKCFPEAQAAADRAAALDPANVAAAVLVAQAQLG